LPSSLSPAWPPTFHPSFNPSCLPAAKRAYRQLSILVHPDRCALPAAQDAFAAASQAIQVISERAEQLLREPGEQAGSGDAGSPSSDGSAAAAASARASGGAGGAAAALIPYQDAEELLRQVVWNQNRLAVSAVVVPPGELARRGLLHPGYQQQFAPGSSLASEPLLFLPVSAIPTLKKRRRHAGPGMHTRREPPPLPPRAAAAAAAVAAEVPALVLEQFGAAGFGSAGPAEEAEAEAAADVAPAAAPAVDAAMELEDVAADGAADVACAADAAPAGISGLEGCAAPDAGEVAACLAGYQAAQPVLGDAASQQEQLLLEAVEAQEQQQEQPMRELQQAEQEQQPGGSEEEAHQHGDQQQEGAEAEEEEEGVEGLLLVTARTALWGRFPLNGTYFQASAALPYVRLTASNAAGSLWRPQALQLRRAEVEQRGWHASHTLLCTCLPCSACRR
jgi:hypothetical protein